MKNTDKQINWHDKYTDWLLETFTKDFEQAGAEMRFFYNPDLKRLAMTASARKPLPTHDEFFSRFLTERDLWEEWRLHLERCGECAAIKFAEFVEE